MNLFICLKQRVKPHAIGYKWVNKIKYDENGEKIKYKTRLVAKEFTPKLATDYKETFSSSAKHTTIRDFQTQTAYHRAKIF